MSQGSLCMAARFSKQKYRTPDYMWISETQWTLFSHGISPSHATFGTYLHPKRICCLSGIRRNWTSCVLFGKPTYKTCYGLAPARFSNFISLSLAPATFPFNIPSPFWLPGLCTRMSWNVLPSALCVDGSLSFCRSRLKYVLCGKGFFWSLYPKRTLSALELIIIACSRFIFSVRWVYIYFFHPLACVFPWLV